LADEQTSEQTTVGPVVLLGLDNGGKSHASKFPPGQSEAALRAARLMKLRAVRVTDAGLHADLKKLPDGKIFATGRGLVPFVKRELYAKFAALLGTASEESLVDETETKVKDAKSHSGIDPAVWDQLDAGSTVVAKASSEEGWFEAIILSVDREQDAVTLKWRDYPTEPVFNASRKQLGLISA